MHIADFMCKIVAWLKWWIFRTLLLLFSKTFLWRHFKGRINQLLIFLQYIAALHVWVALIALLLALDCLVYACFMYWFWCSFLFWIVKCFEFCAFLSVTYYYYIVWHEISKITSSVYFFHMILKDIAESTSSQKCAVTEVCSRIVVMLLCTCTGDDWWLCLWGADSNINRSDLPDAIWPVRQG